MHWGSWSTKFEYTMKASWLVHRSVWHQYGKGLLGQVKSGHLSTYSLYLFIFLAVLDNGIMISGMEAQGRWPIHPREVRAGFHLAVSRYTALPRPGAVLRASCRNSQQLHGYYCSSFPPKEVGAHVSCPSFPKGSWGPCNQLCAQGYIADAWQSRDSEGLITEVCS